MSYAIYKVVCGCPLHQALKDYLYELGIKHKDIGFESVYRSDGHLDGYCGIVLGEFDCETTLVSSIRFTPTTEEIGISINLLKNAKEKLQKILDEEMTLEDEDTISLAESESMLQTIPMTPDVWLVRSDS